MQKNCSFLASFLGMAQKYMESWRVSVRLRSRSQDIGRFEALDRYPVFTVCIYVQHCVSIEIFTKPKAKLSTHVITGVGRLPNKNLFRKLGHHYETDVHVSQNCHFNTCNLNPAISHRMPPLHINSNIPRLFLINVPLT